MMFLLNVVFLGCILSSVPYLMIILLLLINVAFFVLLERKLLGLSQSRVSPNVVSLLSILQTLVDGINLVSKNTYSLSSSVPNGNVLHCGFITILSLILWTVVFDCNMLNLILPVLMILLISALQILLLYTLGWNEYSAWGSLGSCRTVALMISFEILFPLLLVVSTSSLVLEPLGFSCEAGVFSVNLGISFLWIIVVSLEMGRTPYDLLEGESELVSGFNTEYGGIGFTSIFLGEYLGVMFFSSWILVWISSGSDVIAILSNVILLYCLLILIRSSFPRLNIQEALSNAWFDLIFVIIVIVIIMM